MEIRHALSSKDKDDLDQLLWDVLWQPLGLPRNVRETLELEGPQMELVAVNEGTIVGGLVAYRISKTEIELRHIAVTPGYQRLSAGRQLINGLIDNVRDQAVPQKIQAWARNTATGFYSRLGFVETGSVLEHADFARFGISFRQVYLDIVG